MIFPDHAPSRMRVARRSTSADEIRRRLISDREDEHDAAVTMLPWSPRSAGTTSTPAATASGCGCSATCSPASSGLSEADAAGCAGRR